MKQNKVIQTLYSGLGGHSSVVFPFLENSRSKEQEHLLIFYGIEPVAVSTLDYVQKLNIDFHYLPKKRGQYRTPFRKFKNWIQEHEPTAIIVHNSELLIPALTYAKKNRKCSIIYVEHQDQNKKGLLLKQLSKMAARKANAVVCLNEESRQILLKHYSYRCPISVIPNGINTELFHPSTEKRDEIRTIGMASRMVAGKDHPTLLKAFAQILKQHPNIRLKIAGDGPTLTSTISLANQLKISSQVDFFGRLDEKEMPNFYREIDLYVQATFAETLCTSILQAFSSKTLVIASDIPNNRSLLEDGRRGLLFTVENATQLAEKITGVINSPKAYKPLIEAAESAINNEYSADLMTSRYIQLINGNFEQI